MEGGADHRLEYLFALLRHAVFGTAAAQPIFIIGLGHDGYPADHTRVFRPAILGTEQMIAARLGGGEPHRVVAAGHYVMLDAKSRNEKAVDDVFRRQRYLHWPANGHVEFVNLTRSFRILNLPRPRLSNPVNATRIL